MPALLFEIKSEQSALLLDTVSWLPVKIGLLELQFVDYTKVLWGVVDIIFLCGDFLQPEHFFQLKMVEGYILHGLG